MPQELVGKVALVTGSSRGIGKAIALRLAGDGATVALNATKDTSETERAIREAGGSFGSYIADVSRSDQVVSLVETVVADCGSIDILVNNAGINRDTLLLRISDDDWDDVLGTNLRGSFLCTRAAVRHMIRKRWGRILNMGSVVGLRGNAGQANYTAAKAGLVGFTKSVAQEVASRGVTANVIAPGFIETDMTGKLTESQREQVRQHIPAGRFGSPEEVAEVVAFLAGEEASYITGQVVKVDGGLALR